MLISYADYRYREDGLADMAMKKFAVVREKIISRWANRRMNPPPPPTDPQQLTNGSLFSIMAHGKPGWEPCIKKFRFYRVQKALLAKPEIPFQYIPTIYYSSIFLFFLDSYFVVRGAMRKTLPVGKTLTAMFSLARPVY